MHKNEMMTVTIKHKIFKSNGSPVMLRKEVLDKIKEVTGRYPQKKSALLPILHIVQEETGGYLSVDAMDYVASLLEIQPIEVYEVGTFYTQFYVEKQGKYIIEVCRTAPCAVCGGEDMLAYLQHKLGIRDGETTPDGLFSLKSVECLGACGQAPVMQVNTIFFEHLSHAEIDRILTELKDNPDFLKTTGHHLWAESC
jgi:NADH-quinone oxidoreductase subunit E